MNSITFSQFMQESMLDLNQSKITKLCFKMHKYNWHNAHLMVFLLSIYLLRDLH